MIIARTHPSPWDDVGLEPTTDVWEKDYVKYSSILGPDGEPLAYENPKQEFIGFTRLKQRER